MPLTIISLIKQVPLPSEMRMGEDGLMDRTKAKSIINIDCQFGLEAGLQLRKQNPDARLIVCSMGPGSFETFAEDSRFQWDMTRPICYPTGNWVAAIPMPPGWPFQQCSGTWALQKIPKIRLSFWPAGRPATGILLMYPHRLLKASEYPRLPSLKVSKWMAMAM